VSSMKHYQSPPFEISAHDDGELLSIFDWRAGGIEAPTAPRKSGFFYFRSLVGVTSHVSFQRPVIGSCERIKRSKTEMSG
jgi:hypothetical protein